MKFQATISGSTYDRITIDVPAGALGYVRARGPFPGSLRSFCVLSPRDAVTALRVLATEEQGLYDVVHAAETTAHDMLERELRLDDIAMEYRRRRAAADEKGVVC